MYSISRLVDGVYEELTMSGNVNEVQVDRWYTVTVVAISNNLELLVDGDKVLEVHDDSHPSGTVGFRTWNCTMQVDSINLASTIVSTPILYPPSGTYSSPQFVSISCATSGAIIRYTIDGSDPTSFSTEYSAPFIVSNDTVTVKAKAFRSGWADSNVTSVIYNIEIPPDARA